MRTPLIEKIIGTTEIHKILIEKILSEYEKGQEEGESIHITDSSNLPMILRPQGQIIQDTRNGYNLLPLFKYIDVGFTKTINGITITVLEDFSIKVTGKRTSNAPIDFYLFGQFTSTAEVLKLNGVYTFSISENPYTGIRGFLLHNSNVCLDTNTNNKVISEELENITVSALLIRIETDNELNEIIYPMLYEGSEEKEYEEYGQKPSTSFSSAIKYVKGNYNCNIKNKNFFKAHQNSGSVVNKGITCEMLSYNKLKLNGTSTAELWIEIGSNFIAGTSESYASKFINLDTTKNYMYQIKKIEGNTSANVNIHLQVLPTIGNKGLTISPTSDNPNIEIFDSDGIYRTWIYLPNGITCNNLIIEIQIEASETVSDIIEPQSQNLSLTLPENVKLYGKEDGFVYLTDGDDGAGWYVYNKWNKLSLNGNENWILNNSKDNIYQYRMRYIDDAMYSIDMFSSIGDAYCNMKTKNSSENGNLINTLLDDNLFTINGNKELVINDTATNLEEFKTKLSSLNMYIVYRTEKPVYTKITDNNFIKQLEELQKVFSHEGITNIDTYSTDSLEKAPLILSVEYLKSQKIINKNLDERITALENALINNI